MAKRPSLGRGLAALLPDPPSFEAVADDGIRQIPLSTITPNPYQPRLHFNEEQLAHLAESIRTHGILQPILVMPKGDGYQLVAGERRVQAARLAGLTTIPAQVKEFDNRALLAIALIENVQRAELDPIEKARALNRLKDEFGATQEELAKEVGMSRPTIANLLRLLDLPDAVQAALRVGILSTGHAKLLVPLAPGEQILFAGAAIEQGWSVRQLEAAIARGALEIVEAASKENGAATVSPSRPAPKVLDPDLARLEQQLSERFGTPCALKLGANKAGTLAFQFYSLEDADRLIRRLLRD